MANELFVEEVIFSIKYTQVSKTADEHYFWEKGPEVNNKRDDKLLSIIKTTLTAQLSKNHKDYISYHIVSILNGESMLIEQSLNIRYMPGSDFDVGSIVEECQRVVKNAFESLDAAVKLTNGQAHKAKITLINIIDGSSESDYIVVKSEVEKSIVEKIITSVSLKSSDDVACKVNICGDEINVSLPLIDHSSVISDKSKVEVVSVICVDDKRMKTKVLSRHDYKHKEFYFNEDLRDELLLAQLHNTILQIEVVPNEKLNLGEWIEDGGSIFGLKKADDNKLI